MRSFTLVKEEKTPNPLIRISYLYEKLLEADRIETIVKRDFYLNLLSLHIFAATYADAEKYSPNTMEIEKAYNSLSVTLCLQRTELREELIILHRNRKLIPYLNLIGASYKKGTISSLYCATSESAEIPGEFDVFYADLGKELTQLYSTVLICWEEAIALRHEVPLNTN